MSARRRAGASKRPEASRSVSKRPFVVALAGQKGGVGKTTTATSIADAWCARGLRVLLVDTDHQRSALAWSDLREQHASSSAGDGASCTGGLTVVAMGDGMHRQLPALATGYDVVVIDCPPQIADAQRAALGVADLVVLPCGPGGPDVRAMAGSVALVREAIAFRPHLEARVLITRRVVGTVIGRAVRETLERTELTVLSAECCQRVTYQEAFSAGLGPVTYDPASTAASEVAALVDELERGRR